MRKRSLGASGIEVSPLGLGCWAIGGPFTMFGLPDGWGEVDDEESVRAIRRAVELGVRFFDTADAYGTGHSERVLGRALADVRDEVVIATKFGYTYDETAKALTGSDPSPSYVRWACEQSLKRLGTDRIDLFQLHIGDLPVEEAMPIQSALEDLVREGWIRSYGWSTDDPDRASAFTDEPHYVAVQHDLNLFADAPAMLTTCEDHGLLSVNRTPLAMGFLTGKFTADSKLPADDVRANAPWIRWFVDGRPAPEFLRRLDAVREILRSDGRTLAQGALGWIWARSEHTVPVPGFKTVAQVEENAGAMAFGPLPATSLAEIDALLTAAG